MATVDDKKIIFSMVGLNKTIQQNNKQVLKNIYLSFFYGAKIGIIGLNGSGKSTLLKIIAGLDKSYQGEVVFSPGYSVGYLAQEPYLDPTKTVKEIVMEGVQPIVDALAEYEEINQKFGLPEYYEDADKMDKIIYNLLSNAIRFTPSGGQITVVLRQGEGEVAVSVSDTGVGMDEETQRHIFDKFYRAEPYPDSRGNGLGLSIVRRAVELCGGEIEVFSQPGKGSTFTVTLSPTDRN